MEQSQAPAAFRELNSAEIELVAGGSGTVWGPSRWSWLDYQEYYAPQAYSNADFDFGSYDNGGGGGGAPSTSDPTCTNSNAITGLTPPDGAKYWVPENVTVAYMHAALNHLSAYAASHTAAALLFEFKSMYTDRNHPHYIDFKDWGTSGGPTGSPGAPPVTYQSAAAGGDVTASPFEAFGNFFFGYAGTWAGISPDILYAAAALFQEGDTGWIPNDAPEDRPHVNYGIAAARAYAANPQTQMGVVEGSCGSSTPQQMGGVALQAQADYTRAYNDPTYREGLWGGLNYYYNTV